MTRSWRKSAMSATDTQIIPLTKAQLCLDPDCQAISNVEGDTCPACGFRGLTRISQHVNAIPIPWTWVGPDNNEVSHGDRSNALDHRYAGERAEMAGSRTC
jgi:hypothetical protein